MNKYKLRTIKEDEKYLRQKSSNVEIGDLNTKEYISVLSEYCKNNEIFALAAIQLGIPKKIIYVKTSNEDNMYKEGYDDGMVMINPQILEEFGETYYFEYCMSCLDNMAKVKSPYKIKVKYLDQEFNLKEEVFEGLKATIFSHEYDHLYGILHMDISNEIYNVTFDKRKEFREKEGHGYQIISKTKKYKHPLR